MKTVGDFKEECFVCHLLNLAIYPDLLDDKYVV